MQQHKFNFATVTSPGKPASFPSLRVANAMKLFRSRFVHVYFKLFAFYLAAFPRVLRANNACV